MRPLLAAGFAFLRAMAMLSAALALENAALRQQLAVFHRSGPCPRLRPGDWVFWVVLRRLWADWPRHFVLVTPATARDSRCCGWKSRPGRPRIPRRHIASIRRA